MVLVKIVSVLYDWLLLDVIETSVSVQKVQADISKVAMSFMTANHSTFHSEELPTRLNG